MLGTLRVSPHAPMTDDMATDRRHRSSRHQTEYSHGHDPSSATRQDSDKHRENTVSHRTGRCNDLSCEYTAYRDGLSIRILTFPNMTINTSCNTLGYKNPVKLPVRLNTLCLILPNLAIIRLVLGVLIIVCYALT